MNFQCKAWPEKHKLFPGTIGWMPIVNVRLLHGHTQLKGTHEAIVDSGAPYCMLHANYCKPLGIKRLEDGEREPLSGIIDGLVADMYFHKIKVFVGAEQFETMAGFCEKLAVGILLGRHGFFENFTVKFDCSMHPPTIELERIHRS